MTTVRSNSGINKTTHAGMAEAQTWPILAVHEAMVDLEGWSGNGSGEPEAAIYRCLDIINEDPPSLLSGPRPRIGYWLAWRAVASVLWTHDISS